MHGMSIVYMYVIVTCRFYMVGWPFVTAGLACMWLKYTSYDMCFKCAASLIGASLSEPHSNMESGVVVHARRAVAKTGLQHTTVVLVRWFSLVYVHTLPYKCFVMRK